MGRTGPVGQGFREAIPSAGADKERHHPQTGGICGSERCGKEVEVPKIRPIFWTSPDFFPLWSILFASHPALSWNSREKTETEKAMRGGSKMIRSGLGRLSHWVLVSFLRDE